MIPDDPYKKAQVRAICEIINSGIQPMQNTPVIREVKNIGGDVIRWGNKWNIRGLSGKNDLLE